MSKLLLAILLVSFGAVSNLYAERFSAFATVKAQYKMSIDAIVGKNTTKPNITIIGSSNNGYTVSGVPNTSVNIALLASNNQQNIISYTAKIVTLNSKGCGSFKADFNKSGQGQLNSNLTIVANY